MSYDLIDTTISGGASTKWSPELFTLFKNANVVIIPDNDAPGLKYANYVADGLVNVCESVKVINLPVGKDVSEYLENKTTDNLINMVENTNSYLPEGLVTREEFETFRGIVKYLLRPKRKYEKYND